jgi:hypothetical protein
VSATLAVSTARTAPEVRKALVRELRAERAELDALDLRGAGKLILKLQGRAIVAAHRDPSLMDADRNGVTMLEVSLVRAISEVMLVAYWPAVASMWAMGAGMRKPKPQPVDGLEYDELLDLYDSVHARLSREAITNAAWRLATITLNAARKVPRRG